MTADVTMTMNDGRSIPALGFGCYLVPGQDAVRVVTDAVAAGYRLVDTATIYANEEFVGEAVAGRDDIFLTTKVWRDSMGFDATLRAFEASAARLGRDSVDLYLIHWPMPSLGLQVDTWKALVRLREEGRAKSIGVSNFNIGDIDLIVDATGVVPALNQIELNPDFQQHELRAYHRKHGIVTQSWGPLGQGDTLNNPAIVEVAARHGVTPAQAILAWHRQHGLATIPKASTRARMDENLASLGVTLDEAAMTVLDELDRADGRRGPDPLTF